MKQQKFEKGQKVQHKIGRCTFAFHVDKCEFDEEKQEFIYSYDYGDGRKVPESELEESK